MRSRFRLVALSLLACFACAAKTASVPPASAPPSAPVVAKTPWLTRLDREHALVGKIWDVKAHVFVGEQALLSRAAAARFVLLGERHDNADHHRLQARVLSELVRAGRHPAVALEMLEIEQQPSIDAYVAQPSATAAGFGAALGWEKTSWPPFSEYQPIFEAAFVAKLPIQAANVAQSEAKALVKEGLAVLGDARVSSLKLTTPLPAAAEQALLEELSASHCGMLPEKLLPGMALSQHARDAQMAQVLAATKPADGAVLIAGGGHARLDRGVPFYLRLIAEDAPILSVSFQEVQHGATKPATYAGETGPFDFVWFTPRGSDEDPCAAFKHPKP